jgi:uridine phosphorylase
MPASDAYYHIGFGASDLGSVSPTLAVISGDPNRAKLIGHTRLTGSRVLSENRGLNSYIGALPSGKRILSCTSGMGGPSLSIVVNELVQVGIRTIIRIGTCGSLQARVLPGHVVISSAAYTRQGSAHDIAPVEYPAVADPFLTVALADAAERLSVPHAVGITASMDTFFEGQERAQSSANPHLQRWIRGQTDELRAFNVINYEMEAGTLFKMGSVYGFRAACICGVVALRTQGESVVMGEKDLAVKRAIDVALAAAEAFA